MSLIGDFITVSSNRNTIFIIYLRKYPTNLIVPLTMNMFSYSAKALHRHINKIHLKKFHCCLTKLNEKSVRNNFYSILKVSLTSFVLNFKIIETKIHENNNKKFCYCMENSIFERLLWRNCQHFLSILT